MGHSEIEFESGGGLEVDPEDVITMYKTSDESRFNQAVEIMNKTLIDSMKNKFKIEWDLNESERSNFMTPIINDVTCL